MEAPLDPTGFDATEFRREADAFLGWIARYFSEVENFPVRARVRPGTLRAALPPAPPPHGESFDNLLEDLDRLIVPGLTHWQSPNFFAYFPANVSVPSLMGELVSSALGVQGMLWITSPACTELETHMLDWLAQACAIPARFDSRGPGGGVLQDSASSAVLCALLAARERASEGRAAEEGCDGRGVVYGSSQTHSSLDKAVMVAGLGRRHLRKLPVDDGYALVPGALRAALAADRAAGLTPTILSSSQCRRRLRLYRSTRTPPWRAFSTNTNGKRRFCSMRSAAQPSMSERLARGRRTSAASKHCANSAPGPMTSPA